MAADPNTLLRAAEAHFAAGRHGEARPLTAELLRLVPNHPALLHLHGLVLSGLGALAEARQALEAAHRLAPADPQIANNLGNLLGRIGEPGLALAAYDAAIAADPAFAPARLHRAMALDTLGRVADARAEFDALEKLGPLDTPALLARAALERGAGDIAASSQWLDKALALDPANPAALRGRARAAAERGEPGAAERHRQALAADPSDRDLVLSYLGAAGTPPARADAVARLSRLLDADPAWSEGHAALAATRWEDGERDGFAASYEAALAARPADAALWSGYVSALSKVERFADAAALCARAGRATADPRFAPAGFGFLSAAGDIAAADALLARLPPGAIGAVARAKHALRKRQPEDAEPLLARATAEAPGDIEAWALRGIAWQMLGDPRFDWLNGQPGLVDVADLSLSPAEIATIADRLRLLHAASAERVGQSVRGGTQTPGNLFDRAEPEIARLRDAIAAAAAAYWDRLPPADPAHPILRHRNRPLAFAASWSVRLTGSGFHVQHIHAGGLVSAASYWAVPPEGGGDPHAGWLEIGGTPAYLALDLPPLRRVAPKVGRLALFPSTLHHGTRPFEAGERMTVAFDLVAAPA